MTTAQRWVLAVVAACTAVACFAAAAVTCAGCAALEADAKAVQAPLVKDCAFLESATGDNPYVEWACLTAEAADALVASFPAGSASASTAVDASPNGPPVPAVWRVHLCVGQRATVSVTASDGGPR